MMRAKKTRLKVLLAILIIVLSSAIAIHFFMPGTKIHASKCVRKPQRVPVNIIFNAAPKSASVYIAKMLEVGLRCDQLSVSNGYFPHDNLSYEDLIKFYQSPAAIAKTHIDASLINQQLLKKFAKGAIVHFRDPREILLSWVHYIQRIHDEHKIQYLYHVAPTPPEEYFSWSQTKRIDWNIDNFLPELITWMQNWILFQEQQNGAHDGFKILITTYDEFLHNEHAFYKQILDFYNIPEAQFQYLPQTKDMQLHYRRADQNEWTREFTPAQKLRIAKIVPIKLLHRFNWQP